MTKNEDKHPNFYLEGYKMFENRLSDENSRNFAYQLLYKWYFHWIKIAAKFCELPKSAIEYHAINRTWGRVREILESENKTVKFDGWNNIFKNMAHYRDPIAHKLSGDPPSEKEILKWRHSAENFPKFLTNPIRNYRKSLPTVKMANHLAELVEKYIWRADSLLREYGKEDIPFVLHDPYAFDDSFDYSDLPDVIKRLKTKIRKIDNITKYSLNDISDIIKIVEFISIFRGREYTYIEKSVCPKCGGEIQETSSYYGGNEMDPEPTGLTYRVGCNKCDYTLNVETIDL